MSTISSSNIKGLVTSFSPSLDFLAIAPGDGRIKIWDTVKGELQTEFSNITRPDISPMLAEARRGHLSLDYNCMRWVYTETEKRKKKKNINRAFASLLILGTGNGDVLALDVSTGQLKWEISDCHPGGVTAISSAGFGLCIYTAGIDGMVCQMDSLTGSLVSKFKPSTKAISSIAISPDGMQLAAASAQMKVFSCTDHKKLQKFSGHSVAVRCMIFSEDGSYILSSGVGERYVAIWRLDGAKKHHASCVLPMEHPPVFLDCKGTESTGSESNGLHILTISEVGVCYFWHGKSIEKLNNSKPTRIFMTPEPFLKHKSLGIFAAKINGLIQPTSGLVLVAYGLLVKPSFQKLTVHIGVDISLSPSHNGLLLPVGPFSSLQKGQVPRNKVIILDQANAEDAVHPIPKLNFQGKKRKHSMPHVSEETKDVTIDPFLHNKTKSGFTGIQVHAAASERMVEKDVSCLEEKLRTAGILSKPEDIKLDACEDSASYNHAHLLIETDMAAKKVRAHVLSMSPDDAFKFLEILVSMWKTRFTSSKQVLLWLYSILSNHGHSIFSQEPSAKMLHDLHKVTVSKSEAAQSLLNLSGRIQLIMTQIDKTRQNTSQASFHESLVDEDEDEDEDDDIDEIIYGEKNESESDSEEDIEQKELY